MIDSDLTHPLKVDIIEALLWIGLPLSASELKKILSAQSPLSVVSYHLVRLAKLDVLERVRTRQVRGATQSFYYFPTAYQDRSGPAGEAN